MTNKTEIERLQDERDRLEERAEFHRRSAENSRQRDYRTYGYEATCKFTRELLDKAENAEKMLRDIDRKLELEKLKEKSAEQHILQALLDTNWQEQTKKDTGDPKELTPLQLKHREFLEKNFQPKIDACIAVLLATPDVEQSEQGQRILHGLQTPGSVIYAEALSRFIQRRITELELEDPSCSNQNTQYLINRMKNHPPLTYDTDNYILDTLLEKINQPDNKIAQTLLEKLGDKNDA